MIASKNKAGAKSLAFYLLLAATIVVSMFAEALNQLVPLPLGGAGWAALAVLAFAILSWCLQLAPIAVTALALLALLPFTGLMDFAGVIEASFGDSTFAFFLGVLLLSAAFQKTPLGKRIALLIFKVFGCAPRQVLLGLMLAGTLLAMWVTEVAAAAILYPLALSIVEQSRSRPDAVPLARALMLGVAWGPAFGGVATPIATGANLVAVTYLEQYADINVSFGEWMVIGLPISFTLLVAGWMLLSRELPRTAAPLELDSNIPPHESQRNISGCRFRFGHLSVGNGRADWAFQPSCSADGRPVPIFSGRGGTGLERHCTLHQLGFHHPHLLGHHAGRRTLPVRRGRMDSEPSFRAISSAKGTLSHGSLHRAHRVSAQDFVQ